MTSIRRWPFWAMLWKEFVQLRRGAAPWVAERRNRRANPASEEVRCPLHRATVFATAQLERPALVPFLHPHARQRVGAAELGDG